MTIEKLAEYISQNGIWILFALVALENVGIPGYPGGFTLPAVGVLMQLGLVAPFVGFVVAITASSLMMVLIYLVGKFCGGKLSVWLLDKQGFVKHYNYLRGLIEKYGSPALFVARLIPVVRVFVSITAGLLGMEWRRYAIYSFFSNLLYTIAAMLLGYFGSVLFV